MWSLLWVGEMVKLKFKPIDKDHINGGFIYECSLCKKKFDKGSLDDHAKEHKRNSYMIRIDVKKEKN